jgi:hypothetical protein
MRLLILFIQREVDRKWLSLMLLLSSIERFSHTMEASPCISFNLQPSLLCLLTDSDPLSVGDFTIEGRYSVRPVLTYLSHSESHLWCCYITVDFATTKLQTVLAHIGAFPNKCTRKHSFHTTAAWKVRNFMKTTRCIQNQSEKCE